MIATIKLRIIYGISTEFRQKYKLKQALRNCFFELFIFWRIVCIYAEATAWRHIVDDIHIALVQLKIKYFCIFDNTVFVGGLG